MIPFNANVRDTGTPPIPEAQGWAKRYDGALGPMIDLSQAVPGYPPHADLLSRLAEAAGTQAAAKYGDIYGDEGLRQSRPDATKPLCWPSWPWLKQAIMFCCPPLGISITR